MDEGVSRSNHSAIGVGVKGIAGDDLALCRQLGFRSRADQCANLMSAFEENGDESGADVAGPPVTKTRRESDDRGRDLTFSKSRISEMDAVTAVVRS